MLMQLLCLQSKPLKLKDQPQCGCLPSTLPPGSQALALWKKLLLDQWPWWPPPARGLHLRKGPRKTGPARGGFGGPDCMTSATHIETLRQFPGAPSQSLTLVTSNILLKPLEPHISARQRRKQLLGTFSSLIHSSKPS